MKKNEANFRENMPTQKNNAEKFGVVEYLSYICIRSTRLLFVKRSPVDDDVIERLNY